MTSKKITVHVEIQDSQPPKVTVTPPPAPAPGSLAKCNDGTVSESGGKPGACAWHGGVKR